LTGVGTEFDEAAGLGMVTGEDGLVYGFHCTQIAGGSRTIASGTRVCFDVVAWHRGRYEAVALSPEP
jgi:cold shock CspA family protein